MHFSFTHVFFYRFAIKAGGFPVMKILLFIHFLFFVVYILLRNHSDLVERLHICRGIYGAVPQDLSGCATKCKLQKIKNV